MDKEEFCGAYVAWFPENEERYREHKREFPHILLHVFSVFAVNIPMAEAYEGKDRAGFEKFCSFIEYVWRKADDEVLNVLDTTVLEGISENLPMWTAFGNCIHEDFRTYINTVLIRQMS